MEQAFWIQRWKEQQIGFHQSEINPYLQRHFDKLSLNSGDGVFVPLCGKSKDLLWLADQELIVKGVELSRIAISAFFTENNIKTDDVTDAGGFEVWTAEPFKLFCGDFFNLSAEDMKDVKAVFDRAALIALPPMMRANYVAHLKNILPSGCRLLLVTMEYAQSQMDGPPFAVMRDEVLQLFSDGFSVTSLERVDILADNQRFVEKGLTKLEECCYWIEKN